MMIKKAELHTHLEGTIRPELALKLAKRNHLSLPPTLITPDGQGYSYTDFMDFLNAYDKVAAVIKKPLDYYDLTLDYLSSNAKEGVIYVEMMYSPDHAESSSGIPSHEHLSAIQEAIDKAEKSFGIRGRIIITAVRHFGPEAAIRVAEQGIKEDYPCIVGFGLGGDEFNFPPKLFKRAYEIAKEGGLSCTVHAGEFASAEGMIEAMDNLPIERIGHGVMSIHSEDTMARLIDKNITLEICPTSNIVLGLFSDLKAHPLGKFKQRGIKCCLNSDDPPFFNTTVAKEYEKVQAFYQYSDETMLDFTKMAIEASFADAKTKKELLNQCSS